MKSAGTVMRPSGEQHEVAFGRQRVVIAGVGATLRSYDVGDEAVVDGFDEDEICSAGRGQVLAPWPNRLAEGRYDYDGVSARAAIDEPERHNAIHGLVRWLAWQVRYRAQNVLGMGCTLEPQPGYPWRLDLGVEYRLGRDGLSVTATASNPSDRPIPFGMGFHPYISAGTGRVDECRLHLPGSTRLVTDDRGLPTGEATVGGTEYDFLAPRAVGSTRLDTAYTNLARGEDGLARVALERPGPSSVTMWADSSFPYFMAYTGDTLDPPQRRRASIAIEPMTCPPNALRSGTDVITIEPGASWTGRWGLVIG
jgi:aldose 1-epimerase